MRGNMRVSWTNSRVGRHRFACNDDELIIHEVVGFL